MILMEINVSEKDLLILVDDLLEKKITVQMAILLVVFMMKDVYLILLDELALFHHLMMTVREVV